MINAVISGTGSYTPGKELTNAELETIIDTDHEWILARTGIVSRCIVQPNETTSSMAAKAAEHALASAQLEADDIDLILVATCTPEAFFPSVACFVQHALKSSRSIPAFDISAACSGFIYAMDIAKQYIATETAKHVLVIGSESMSKVIDWSDRGTCILFGDGAGAVVLSASEREGVLGSVLHSSYDSEQLLTLNNGAMTKEHPTIKMRGNEVFKLAVRIMGEVVDEVLDLSKLNKSNIDWLIPQQANIRIIQEIGRAHV
jgi:3-oxoacyl-[acyl-carrier-protein] synthase-3